MALSEWRELLYSDRLFHCKTRWIRVSGFSSSAIAAMTTSLIRSDLMVIIASLLRGVTESGVPTVENARIKVSISPESSLAPLDFLRRCYD